MAAPARRADFSDGARLCDGPGDRSFARFCAALLRAGDALCRGAGLDTETAAASIIRRCCATSAATPTRICSRRRSATRSRCGGISAHRHAATSRKSAQCSSAPSTRAFPNLSPEELAQGGRREACRGDAGQRPILSGHCEVAQRIAERHRPVAGDSRKPRPALRALGRQGTAARPQGQCGASLPVRMVTLAQDAIALTEAHGFDDHEGDDRQARRRRLRAGARRSLPRHMPRR